MKLKYNHYSLPNGVRVFTVPKKETMGIFINVIFRVGSRYENIGIDGVAHFIEHMNFKGTKKRLKSTDIKKEIHQVGGTINAYTSKETTGYYVSLPARKVELGVDILSDILLNSRFDTKDIEKEKGVIIEEIKMYDDMPADYAFMKFEELIFGKNPLGSDIAGSIDSIKKMTRKDLINFKNRFYSAQNTVIAVGGKFSEVKLKGLLTKKFGKIKKASLNTSEKTILKQDSPLVKIYKRDSQQANILMGFRAFGRNRSDHDRTTIDLLSRIIGGYSSSILFDEIREKRALVYDISSWTRCFDETGAFVISAGVNCAKLEESVSAILKKLKEIKNNGLKPEYIKRAKDFELGRLDLSIEASSSWAANIANQALYEKDIDLPENIARSIKKVTALDLKKMAGELFQPKNLNLVIVAPIDKKQENKYLKLIKL
ncbi:MAG TPA: pitrilysin family protein [Patescibacteria group bacterium]|nr:pitrilysin family protein [Patescibacteria group bacterium]